MQNDFEKHFVRDERGGGGGESGDGGARAHRLAQLNPLRCGGRICVCGWKDMRLRVGGYAFAGWEDMSLRVGGCAFTVERMCVCGSGDMRLRVRGYAFAGGRICVCGWQDVCALPGCC